MSCSQLVINFVDRATAGGDFSEFSRENSSASSGDGDELAGGGEAEPGVVRVNPGGGGWYLVPGEFSLSTSSTTPRRFVALLPSSTHLLSTSPNSPTASSILPPATMALIALVMHSSSGGGPARSVIFERVRRAMEEDEGWVRGGERDSRWRVERRRE